MKKHINLSIISVTFFSLFLVTGCNKAEDHTSMPEKPNVPELSNIKDSDITSSVRVALLNSEALKDIKIAVKTRKGDVLLTGEVAHQDLIYLANQVVERIAGVHTIHNHLTVTTP